ncbi:hypothetical protein B0T14DRAFT_558027 [Immersiella caudata]|uniref:Uncharacterized protein n=1 Tax=Immersiella caudata TaxID=314043 RepID=A0AA39WBW3_9PEZI|nr:hypothetical protein B0T14DRAFT_558027 [Immersiella caudata]
MSSNGDNPHLTKLGIKSQNQLRLEIHDLYDHVRGPEGSVRLGWTVCSDALWMTAAILELLWERAQQDPPSKIVVLLPNAASVNVLNTFINDVRGTTRPIPTQFIKYDLLALTLEKAEDSMRDALVVFDMDRGYLSPQLANAIITLFAKWANWQEDKVPFRGSAIALSCNEEVLWKDKELSRMFANWDPNGTCLAALPNPTGIIKPIYLEIDDAQLGPSTTIHHALACELAANRPPEESDRRRIYLCVMPSEDSRRVASELDKTPLSKSYVIVRQNQFKQDLRKGLDMEGPRRVLFVEPNVRFLPPLDTSEVSTSLRTIVLDRRAEISHDDRMRQWVSKTSGWTYEELLSMWELGRHASSDWPSVYMFRLRSCSARSIEEARRKVVPLAEILLTLDGNEVKFTGPDKFHLLKLGTWTQIAQALWRIKVMGMRGKRSGPMDITCGIGDIARNNVGLVAGPAILSRNANNLQEAALLYAAQHGTKFPAVQATLVTALAVLQHGISNVFHSDITDIAADSVHKYYQLCKGPASQICEKGALWFIVGAITAIHHNPTVLQKLEELGLRPFNGAIVEILERTKAKASRLFPNGLELFPRDRLPVQEVKDLEMRLISASREQLVNWVEKEGIFEENFFNKTVLSGPLPPDQAWSQCLTRKSTWGIHMGLSVDHDGEYMARGITYVHTDSLRTLLADCFPGVPAEKVLARFLVALDL